MRYQNVQKNVKYINIQQTENVGGGGGIGVPLK